MQKDDSITSAGTEADSGQNDKDIFVSQHGRKPNVSGLPLSNEEIWGAVVIETVEDGNTEWGISLTDSNPKAEDYFKMSDKETAFRLKERLTVNSPISFDKPLRRPVNELAGVER